MCTESSVPRATVLLAVDVSLSEQCRAAMKIWGLGAMPPGFQASFCIYDAGTLSDFLKLLVIRILPCKLKPSFHSYLLYCSAGKDTICEAEDTAIKKIIISSLLPWILRSRGETDNTKISIHCQRGNSYAEKLSMARE